MIHKLRGEVEQSKARRIKAQQSPHLQAVGFDAKQDQPLEEGLAQPCPGSLLVDDDWPQLAMVTHQHSLLGTQDQGNERLWLCCLSGFIYQQLHAHSKA